MTLAYVFWHRPAEGVAPEAYEDRLRAFHATLDLPSAAFRVDDGEYEDWYLVEDWAALGALNDAAVAAARRGEHDAAADLAGAGAGGVYALLRGPAEPPAAAQWASKPRGERYDDYLARIGAPVVWQRQMTLGPRPEFCLGGGGALRGRVV